MLTNFNWKLTHKNLAMKLTVVVSYPIAHKSRRLWRIKQVKSKMSWWLLKFFPFSTFEQKFWDFFVKSYLLEWHIPAPPGIFVLVTIASSCSSLFLVSSHWRSTQLLFWSKGQTEGLV